MKKRLLALLLALSMTAALAACGGKKETSAEEPEQVEDTVPETEETGAEEEPEDSREAAEQPEQPAEPETLPADPAEKPEGGSLPADTTQKPESKPVQKPAEKPVEKPAEKPADSQSKPAAKVDLAAFFETVMSGENRPAMMQAEGEVLDAFYPGLSAIKTNQCGVYTAMISAAVGEIALVEVENAADVQAVKDIFQARIDYQVGDDENPGGAWYPQTIEGWKNGSRIVSNGNYIMLAAFSENVDDVVNSFNDLFA